MKTFKLDFNNNLIFGNNFEMLSDSEALIQDTRTMLLMFQGENPFNTSEGINYYTLASANNKEDIENAIIDRLKDNSRIKSVKNIQIDYSKGTLNLSCQIITQWGELDV